MRRIAWLFILFLCLPTPLQSIKWGKKSKTGGGILDNSYKTKPKQGVPSTGLSYPKSKGRLHGLIKNPRTKSILAGLIAGYAAYKVGKATSKLFRNGMYYYMGDRYYPGPSYGKITCQYDIDDDARRDFNAYYEDNSPVRRVLFECDRYTQRCCGLECCPLTARSYEGSPWWIIVLGFFIVLLLMGLTAFIVYKFSRRILDCVCPSDNAEQANFDQFDAAPPMAPPQQPPPYAPMSGPPAYGFRGEYVAPSAPMYK